MEKMKQLSDLAHSLEQEFRISLELVSGGNSANFDWLRHCSSPGRVNHLRIGEAIILGCETLQRNPIEGLHTDAMTLVAEVIESKVKPSVPSGEICQNAFGTKPVFEDRGMIHHAILGMGRQDVLVSGLAPLSNDVVILGSSSDHIIVESRRGRLRIGEQLRFHLDYGALLAAMTSPYVEKVFLQPRA
jgi:predicted amino acid racemase